MVQPAGQHWFYKDEIIRLIHRNTRVVTCNFLLSSNDAFQNQRCVCFVFMNKTGLRELWFSIEWLQSNENINIKEAVRVFLFTAHLSELLLLRGTWAEFVTGNSPPPRCLRVCPGSRAPGCRGWCQWCVGWIPEILTPETSCRTCWGKKTLI